MKPTFKNMIQGYSGKCDGLVYYYNHKLRRTICRVHVVGRATEQQGKMKAVSQNLKALNVSEGYRQDLKIYTCLYSTYYRKGMINLYGWFNAYVMIMWTMAKQMDINIATLTREQIENDNLPCRTVKQAVEAGLIPLVRDYQILINEM